MRVLRVVVALRPQDRRRLHYEPWELREFEHLECQWPLFFAYLAIDASFRHEVQAATEYLDRLERVLIEAPPDLRLVPELYTVTSDLVRRAHTLTLTLSLPLALSLSRSFTHSHSNSLRCPLYSYSYSARLPLTRLSLTPH